MSETWLFPVKSAGSLTSTLVNGEQLQELVSLVFFCQGRVFRAGCLVLPNIIET